MKSDLTTPNDLCPCGSQAILSHCCLPIIQRKQTAVTAESLLRARYTSFVLATAESLEFILQTHHPKTRDQVDLKQIEDWAKNSKWLGLNIIEIQKNPKDSSQELISFHAPYETDGEVTDHSERSLFQKEGDQWYFFDAESLGPSQPIRREAPKTGRNDPCPCGSSKKYKKCCG